MPAPSAEVKKKFKKTDVTRVTANIADRQGNNLANGEISRARATTAQGDVQEFSSGAVVNIYSISFLCLKCIQKH